MVKSNDIKMREPSYINAETGSCFEATDIDKVKVRSSRKGLPR